MKTLLSCRRSAPPPGAFLLAMLAFCHQSHAQIATGPEGMHIATGTTVGMDSLVMTPGADFLLQNRTITKSYTPATTYVGPSISRVYTISPQISYVGELGLVYDEAALGANDEAALVVAYSDSFNTSVVLLNNSQADPAANLVSVTLYTPFNLYRISAVDNPAAPTGVAGHQSAGALRAWPNPLADVLNLSLESSTLRELPYQILNAQGTRIAAGVLQAGVALRIDVSAWAAGVYWVRAGGGSMSLTKP